MQCKLALCLKLQARPSPPSQTPRYDPTTAAPGGFGGEAGVVQHIVCPAQLRQSSLPSASGGQHALTVTDNNVRGNQAGQCASPMLCTAMVWDCRLTQKAVQSCPKKLGPQHTHDQAQIVRLMHLARSIASSGNQCCPKPKRCLTPTDTLWFKAKADLLCRLGALANSVQAFL